MNNDSVLNFIGKLVQDRITKKQYPSHTTLRTARLEASKHFDNYDAKIFTEILRSLIRERKLFAGVTGSGHWISTQKNNI